MERNHDRRGFPRHFYDLLLTAAIILVCVAGMGVLTRCLGDGPPDVDHQASISVKSDLVLLPVNVTDTKGEFVAGLAKDDFRVFDQNQKKHLAIFQPGDSPVSVGLLVDHSGSMALKLPNVITAIDAFAHSANPADEMFVADFSDRVAMESLGGKLFTSDPMELAKSVSTVSAQGRTALYDAVAQGLKRLQSATRTKKALVIISDGGDNGSRYDYSQILAFARQSGVVIYSIGLLSDSGKDENPKILRQLSKDTGGLSLFSKSSVSVLDASDRISRDLREQYLVGFVPEDLPASPTFRKIHIDVVSPKGETLHVRTRPGYYSFPSSSIER